MIRTKAGEQNTGVYDNLEENRRKQGSTYSIHRWEGRQLDAGVAHQGGAGNQKGHRQGVKRKTETKHEIT